MKKNNLPAWIIRRTKAARLAQALYPDKTSEDHGYWTGYQGALRDLRRFLREQREVNKCK